jgi:acyl-CoA thioesterase I
MAPADGPIVAFGDSLTEGWGAPDEESTPAHLSRLLGRVVLNAGWRGERAEDGWFRLQDSVLRHRPRLVLVGFGANEAHLGEPMEATIANIRRLVAAIREAGAAVVLWSVRHEAYGQGFDQALAAMAQEMDCGLVTDALAGIEGNAALMSDEHHPNGAGYEKLAERLEPEVRSRLERKSGGREAAGRR